MDDRTEIHSDWWKEIVTGLLAVACMAALLGRDAVLRLYGISGPADARAAQSDRKETDAPKHARLFLQSVRVQPTKADGKNWDAYPYPLPDLYVKIRNRTSGQMFQSKLVADTLEASLHVPSVAVKEGDQVEIAVWDKDFQFDDLVGRTLVKITAEMFETKTLELSFDQVVSLKVELQVHSRVGQAGSARSWVANAKR